MLFTLLTGNYSPPDLLTSSAGRLHFDCIGLSADVYSECSRFVLTPLAVKSHRMRIMIFWNFVFYLLVSSLKLFILASSSIISYAAQSFQYFRR